MSALGGTSGHVNAYPPGCLVGNWAEEREMRQAARPRRRTAKDTSSALDATGASLASTLSATWAPPAQGGLNVVDPLAPLTTRTTTSQDAFPHPASPERKLDMARVAPPAAAPAATAVEARMAHLHRARNGSGLPLLLPLAQGIPTDPATGAPNPTLGGDNVSPWVTMSSLAFSDPSAGQSKPAVQRAFADARRL